MINDTFIQKGWTNQVLIQQQGKQISYYIPGYLRMKVKNFTQMNLQSLDAQINSALIFTIYYGDIDTKIVDQIENKIVFQFNRNDALELIQSLEIKKIRKYKQKTINYTIRKLLHARIQSDVFWSPFEIINLLLTITIQSVKIDLFDKKILIKFNLMDYQNNFLKLSYTQQGTFGNYDLAQSKMFATYSNDRVINQFKQKSKQSQKTGLFLMQKVIDMSRQDQITQSKMKQKKLQHFQYAHFVVPLYKFPTVAIATIFLPLWLLAIINLGIFFQDENLADRIASIAALMIAFVALIPTIRDQIPPNPNIVFIEILVYIETMTSLFCLIHSLLVRSQQGFQLQWQTDGLFLLSVIITICTFIAIVILMILHKFKWQPSYNQQVQDQFQEKFDMKKWNNIQCDKHFAQFPKIKVFSGFNNNNNKNNNILDLQNSKNRN